MSIRGLVPLILASYLMWQAPAFAQHKPSPMIVAVPPLESAAVTITCVDCDDPFDTDTHKQVLGGLVKNPYVAELRRALYRQDIVHQFESKAHFDNCDFGSSAAYISSLLEETSRHVQTGEAAKRSGSKAELEGAVKSAFFTLGQAMHAVQDFYAHTNYIELTIPAASKVSDIEVIEPWTDAGRARIGQLIKGGMVSGFVFWGVPQKCASGTLSHADLAKDSANTKSGKKRIPHLQNISQYRVAVFLAREASVSLMRYAFSRWPLLKEVNGNDIAFDVMLDHRGL